MANKYFKSEVGKYVSNGNGKTFQFVQEVMEVDGKDAVLIGMLEKASRVEEVEAPKNSAPADKTDPADPAKMTKAQLVEAIAENGGDIVGNESKEDLIKIYNSL